MKSLRFVTVTVALILHSATTVGSLDFERVEITVPGRVEWNLRRYLPNWRVYWAGANQILFISHGGDALVFDTTTGRVLKDFSVDLFDRIEGIDRLNGVITIRSRDDSARHVDFEPDPVDRSPPPPCQLKYIYEGRPGGHSTFKLAIDEPDGTRVGEWQNVREVFPRGEWSSAGGLRVVDCTVDGRLALLATRDLGSSGAVFLARVHELSIAEISRVGLYGADAFFLKGSLDSIVSIKRNADIEVIQEGAPLIYYPLVASIEGETLAAKRSIRVVQAARAFDYDSATNRVVAFVQGPTEFSYEIAVFEIANGLSASSNPQGENCYSQD